jgi:hypothetical protein
MVFTATIFTKLTVVQLHYVQILYTKFHLNEPKNMGSLGRNWFVKSRSVAVIKLIVTELMAT